jgi:hypothetical protein
MIALAADCLVFELAGGEKVPFSAEMISFDLLGEMARWFDPEFVRHAANAVFHYFKHELGRHEVGMGEFSGALEKVLANFKFEAEEEAPPSRPEGVAESDLDGLAREAGEACELVFFPRLRAEMRQHLQQQPRLLRFHGLRGCVKQLAGTRRWNQRCRDLEEQIVSYLRECASVEAGRADFALLVE